MQVSENNSFEQNSLQSGTLCMIIGSVEEVSEGCVKILPSKGPSFFIRTKYLTSINPIRLVANQEFNEEETEELIFAGFAFLAERDALNYLNRSEHSRFLLTQKLQKKGHKQDCINVALDYLESKNYLSDYRYAISWLRNRRISKSEGCIKLFQHLISRGVSKDIVQDALSEFYEEFSELDMLEKAFSKCLRQNMSQEKIDKKLISWGFSLSMIKEYRKNYIDN